MKKLNSLLISRNNILFKTLAHACISGLKIMNFKFITIIFFLLIVPFTYGQNKIHVIDSLLTNAYNEGKINGNVLLAEKGQIVYLKSFGLANEATKEKLNENSVFGLASVTKQFTAMAIVMLKEQGKLNYDDKIIKYLPELKAYDNISVRNLLNHTSGLPDIPQLQNTPEAKEFVSNLKGNILKNNDVITFLSLYKPKLKFEPDTKFEYSSLGYAVLGSIIERTSGLTYKEFLDNAIFKPLEMNNTYVLSSEMLTSKIKNYANGYLYSESMKNYACADSLIGNNLQVLAYGGGGVYSTLLDLLKWDRALYTDKLVSFSSMKEIFKSAVLKDGTKTGSGFGWFLSEDTISGKSVSHTGGDRGYSTYIERNIDNDRTIIFLQNHSPVMMPAYILKHYFYNIPYPNEIKLSQQQLDAFSGTYEIQKGFNFRIWSENGRIKSQAVGPEIIELFAENELLLFAKEMDAQVQFEKNKQGRITCLYILQNGNKIKAKKK